jgi:hypothetical protein
MSPSSMKTGPTASLRPHCMTMWRAMLVACRRSSVAPLLTCGGKGGGVCVGTGSVGVWGGGACVGT